MPLFITIEGPEQTGKSIFLIPILDQIFKQSGWQVLVSREPGGSKKAEEIRQEIFQLSFDNNNLDKITRLFFKARKIHLQKTIIPFIKNNQNKKSIILLDRYIDSTRVYQGLESGYNLDKIKLLEKQYINNCYPDLTIILLLPGNNLVRILKYRKLLSINKYNKNENKFWNQADINQYIKRQRYYRQLPKIARKYQEKRQFEFINASSHPDRIIKNTLMAIFKKIKSDQEKKIVFKTYQINKQKGLWQDFTDNYLRFKKDQKL